MFYKYEFGQLIFSLEVFSGFYQLSYKDKDLYEYPNNDWYWFDTEEEAREFFGLPPKDDTISPPGVIPPNVI